MDWGAMFQATSWEGGTGLGSNRRMLTAGKPFPGAITGWQILMRAPPGRPSWRVAWRPPKARLRCRHARGGQQGFNGAPDVVLRRMEIQGHEVLFSFGTTQTDPSGLMAISLMPLSRRKSGRENQAAYPGDHFPGDIFDFRFRDLDAQSPGRSQDTLGRQRDELLRILAQLLQRPPLERFGDFFDDLRTLGGFDLGTMAPSLIYLT